MSEKKYTPCGGCGAETPLERCIGCFHPFESTQILKPKAEAFYWLNLADHFTEDWMLFHCRYTKDKMKLDTDLFELSDGWLIKKNGSGMLDLHEVEYLAESIWVLASSRLPNKDGIYKVRRMYSEGENKIKYSSGKFDNGIGYTVYEWLDEAQSESPAEQPRGAGWVKAIRGMIPDGIHSMKLVSKEDVVMRGTGLVTNNAITVITFLNKSTMGETELPENYEGVYYLDESPAEQPVVKQINREWINHALVEFALWYHKTPNKDIANDSCEYLNDKLKEAGVEYILLDDEKLITAAEQPGREVDAIAFAEWAIRNGTVTSTYDGWIHGSKRLTTAQLWEVFKKEAKR